MLTQLRKNPVKSALLVVVLPAVAGVVNATGFLEVGSYSSHITGHVTRLALELGQGGGSGTGTALWFSATLLAFVLGVIFAAGAVELARRQARARYTFPLLVEALVLAGLMGSTGMSGIAPLVWTAMLCFSMGLQNALVTRISGAVVRTTHLTGIITDMGVELVRVVLWGRDELRAQRGGVAQVRHLFQLFRSRELDRLWLHSRIFTSFLVGAILGPLLYRRFAAYAMALPVAVLIALAAFDAVTGLDPWSAAQPPRDRPAPPPAA